MERWKIFGSTYKAMMFALWCDKNGIKVTNHRIYGASGRDEINYIATDEQEAMIPATFKRL